MRMSYEERKQYNRRRAQHIVDIVRRMIDEPIDAGHDRALFEFLIDILNHEDRYMFR